MLALPLTLLSLLVTALAAPTSFEADDTPLPVIIWHGLGDNFAADGLKDVAELIEEVHPGTFVYQIRLADDASGDRSATFLGNTTEQIAKVCDDLARHPILSTAPAVDALGFSQGGLFLRAYVERCNFPPVRSLVTFGSPHNGIAAYAGCGTTDWLCKGAMALLHYNTWSNLVQSRLVPAQYYRDLDAVTGLPSEQYLEHSNLLADINNERKLKNTTYAANLATLSNLVLYTFGEDTTVVPKESEWFAEVNSTSEEVTPLKERKLYTEDWIGLKALDKKGGLVFKTAPGAHMNITDEVLNSTVRNYFGPLSASRSVKSSLQQLLGGWEL